MIEVKRIEESMFSCTWLLQQMAAIASCTVRCTKLRKHFNAILEVLYCFTVVISLPGDASNYNKDKRSPVAGRIQNKVVGRVRQKWELRVRFRLFGPHWSSSQKIKMNQCALLHCGLRKQKISTCCFPSVNIGTSPDRTVQRFSGGMF